MKFLNRFAKFCGAVPELVVELVEVVEHERVLVELDDWVELDEVLWLVDCVEPVDELDC